MEVIWANVERIVEVSDAEIADAMATPVTVMGVKTGIDLVNQMKNIACIIIDDNDKVYTSRNIKIS